MAQPPKGSERRRHPRLKTRHLQASYQSRGLLGRLFRRRGKSGRAMVVDVSLGGACVLLDNPQSPPVELTLELEVLKQPVRLKGRVVRCRPVQGSPLYEIGVRVEDPPQALIGLILRAHKEGGAG